ncbi:MAG: hypothetical protein SH848_08220 [Saprospiraceae bacterium]|nr:hypothetical protein [Saprospiraceae bacterium]MDZ4703900.1 hypothetical protein [Saprospiraceae bacterium]
MKKINFFALLFLIVSLAAGCRATDCGCPMSKNDRQMMNDDPTVISCTKVSSSHGRNGLVGSVLQLPEGRNFYHKT